MRRSEQAQQLRAYLDGTPPDQRNRVVVAGIVLLGLAAAPLMPATVALLALLVRRLRRRRRIGPALRVALAGLLGMHAAVWPLRWLLLRRLHRGGECSNVTVKMTATRSHPLFVGPSCGPSSAGPVRRRSS